MVSKGLLSVVIVLLAASPAGAKGNAEAGLRLAGQWCAGCHQIGAEVTKGTDVPPFRLLANKKGGNLTWVRGWLMDPHPPMEGMALSNTEIDDVIAYMQTLQTTSQAPQPQPH